MKVLLIGPQGCGKGTIGELLSDYTGFPIVSAGQLCRDVEPSNIYYEEVNKYMDKGELVPQDIMADLLRKELSKQKYKKGYFMDGWGRSLIDFKLFDPGFDAILFLNISKETSLDRITSRRVCKECGDVYNIKYNPPKNEGICDECGGKLHQRDDDTPEVVNRRSEIFYSNTVPALKEYKKRGLLLEIDAELDIMTVFENAKKALNI